MNNLKILVIDDEPEILKAYVQILGQNEETGLLKLSEMGQGLFDRPSEQPLSSGAEQPRYQVTTTEQGLEGVNAVAEAIEQRVPYAVALIDMRMPPGIDGLETAKRILALDQNIEIVFVTAYTDRTRVEIGKEIGEQRFFYLKKPFDSDEVRQLAESLTFRWQLARDREQLDHEKEVFVSNMSHELRHPLQVILGICDTILNCKMDKKRRNQFIQDIETEARRLTKLAENLKSDHEFKNPVTMSDLKPVDVINMVDHVIRLLSSEAEKKGLSLIREGEPERRTILGEEDRLVQVLINLIVNAIQYTEQGEVRVILQQEKGLIKIAIVDTGVGISAADQKAVFNEFYRAKSTALKVRGHGLGLSIARDIVAAHQSVLEVDSEPGEGSQFHFILPVV